MGQDGAARALQPIAEPESDQLESKDSDPDHLTFRQHVLAFFKELTAVVVGAVIVASLLRGFVGQMFLIPSISMDDTLQVDDRVVVEKLSGSVERLPSSPILVAGSPAAPLASAVQLARRSSLSGCCPTPAPST